LSTTGGDKGRGQRGALSTALREGGKVGGAAQGGEVAAIVDELPGEHTVEFTFDQEEGWLVCPEVGGGEGGFSTSDRKIFGRLGTGDWRRGMRLLRSARNDIKRWEVVGERVVGERAADLDVGETTLGIARDHDATGEEDFLVAGRESPAVGAVVEVEGIVAEVEGVPGFGFKTALFVEVGTGGCAGFEGEELGVGAVDELEGAGGPNFIDRRWRMGDELLGTGTNLFAVQLSFGLHHITLTTTDYTAHSPSATLTILS